MSITELALLIFLNVARWNLESMLVRKVYDLFNALMLTKKDTIY